jgi:hypothetical protein
MMRGEIKKLIEQKAEEILRQSVTSSDLLNLVYVFKAIDEKERLKKGSLNG